MSSTWAACRRRRAASACSSPASSWDRVALRNRSSSRIAWLNKLQRWRPLWCNLNNLRAAPVLHRLKQMPEGNGHSLDRLFLLHERDDAAASKGPPVKNIGNPDLLTYLMIDDERADRIGKDAKPEYNRGEYTSYHGKQDNCRCRK